MQTRWLKFMKVSFGTRCRGLLFNNKCVVEFGNAFGTDIKFAYEQLTRNSSFLVLHEHSQSVRKDSKNKINDKKPQIK